MQWWIQYFLGALVGSRGGSWLRGRDTSSLRGRLLAQGCLLDQGRLSASGGASRPQGVPLSLGAHVISGAPLVRGGAYCHRKAPNGSGLSSGNDCWLRGCLSAEGEPLSSGGAAWLGAPLPALPWLAPAAIPRYRPLGADSVAAGSWWIQMARLVESRLVHVTPPLCPLAWLPTAWSVGVIAAVVTLVKWVGNLAVSCSF